MKLKQTLIGTALLYCSAFAFAQKTDFPSVIANKDTPFTLKLKDLSGEWRRMKIVGTVMTGSGMEGLSSMMGSLGPLMQAGMMSEMGKGAAKDKGMDAMMPAMMSMMGGMFGGGDPIYYTKGQTVELGSETFVVTYRHKKPAMDFAQMMLGVAKPGEGNDKGDDPMKIMEAGKLNPDSDLTLNLLNTKAIGTINDLRPFDIQKEIEEAKAGMAFAEMLGAGGGGAAGEGAKPDEEIAVEAEPVSILGEVMRAISADATVNKFADDIKARVENNVVIMTGNVKTAQQKARITNLVQREIKAIGGGYTLRNNLTVK